MIFWDWMILKVWILLIGWMFWMCWMLFYRLNIFQVLNVFHIVNAFYRLNGFYMLNGFFKVERFLSVFAIHRFLERGVVVITNAQLHPTRLEIKFCAGSNPAHGVLGIHDGEDLWQWSPLERRLNDFRRSTTPQKQQWQQQQQSNLSIQSSICIFFRCIFKLNWFLSNEYCNIWTTIFFFTFSFLFPW